METSLSYLLAALAVLCLFVVSGKYLERTWFPPSLVFVVAFFSHAFLYMHVILIDASVYTTFAYKNTTMALHYSLLSYVCLFFGYGGYGLYSRAAKKATMKEQITMMPLSTAKWLSFIVLFLICFNYFYAFNSGAFELAKGAGAYEDSDAVSLLYRLGFVSFHAAGPLLLLAFMASTQIHGKGGSVIRRRFFAGLALMLALSLLLMERKTTVSVLLYMAIFYHYRIRAIRPLHLGGLLILLILLQVFTHLRDFGVGILNIDITDLTGTVVALLVEKPWELIVQIATSIPGQDVFTYVLDIVRALEDFKYGSTYVTSFLGLFTPRALGLGSYVQVTPSVWYMNAYAPGTVNHGFDFSMLAEAYINFGSAMPLLFIAIGAVVGKLSRNIRESPSYLKVYGSIVILVALSLSLRSDSNALLKACVYFVLPEIILIKCLNSLRRKSNRAQPLHEAGQFY